jgi:hypothetical protein
LRGCVALLCPSFRFWNLLVFGFGLLFVCDLVVI